jgi:hypothetical protein
MINLDQFLESCAHETKVIQHLATKVPEGSDDYRPTPGQRSMRELMQYLTRTAAVPMAFVADGDWNRAEEITKICEHVTAENFAAEMDNQMDFLRAESAKLEGKDLETEACAMPWGTPCTAGEFIINAVGKSFTAYRMQFFLYLKAAGASDLGSMQCWVGVDPAPAT